MTPDLLSHSEMIRTVKKSKSETTMGKIFGENVQNELRLKREVAQEMYTMTKAKDATIMRTRLVAVAAQKFVSDIATDALQHCKARQAAGVRDKKDKQQRDKRPGPVMNMEDLSKALQEHIIGRYGVNVKHQEYFADNPSAGLESTSRDE
ncbi:transcription initiation factor TFIID subunit 10 [Tanacetum coccineum]